MQTPPVQALGDQVTIEFKVQPAGYYNGTRCAKFNPIVFNGQNWQKPQQVDITFDTYGCCIYNIIANSGGYDWQYGGPAAIFVFGCDERAGYSCKGKHTCNF